MVVTKQNMASSARISHKAIRVFMGKRNPLVGILVGKQVYQICDVISVGLQKVCTAGRKKQAGRQ